MASYFKYKSLDDIRRDAEQLGLAMQFSEDFAPLAKPVQIGPLRAGNSIAIQPMEGCDGTLDGRPDELTFRRYRRFGAGGAKTIWGEATAVVEEGRANPRQLVINDRTASSLEQMLRECRAAHREQFGSDSDLVVGLQLTHSGRYSFQRPLIAFHDPLLDPRTFVDKSRGLMITRDDAILDDDYLQRLEDDYVAAARLAFRIGMDFVDVKQCHRYLLSELLAAKTRPGRYGGSFENRTRFVRNVIGKIRDAVPAAVICSRVNVYDGVPYRRNEVTSAGEPCPFETPVRSSFGADEQNPFHEDLAEPNQLLALLQSLGVPMVNITMGNPYAVMHVTRPFEYPPTDGYETPEHPLVGVWRHFRLTAELQRAFPKLVLVGSGYSWLQQFVYHAAAANLRDGHARVAGIGRAVLPYPDSMRDALAGQPLDRRRVCRTFSYCTNLMRAKHNELGQFPTGCPPFDKEVYGPIWKDAQQQSAGETGDTTPDAPAAT
jgi:2,4-dienoyl-CoA reductase-like NADH-dependent reductase (Old Yellow Enzyme family)